MYECPKDCLSCANSFSEPSATNTGKDVLHCMSDMYLAEELKQEYSDKIKNS